MDDNEKKKVDEKRKKIFEILKNKCPELYSIQPNNHDTKNWKMDEGRTLIYVLGWIFEGTNIETENYSRDVSIVFSKAIQKEFLKEEVDQIFANYKEFLIKSDTYFTEKNELRNHIFFLI